MCSPANPPSEPPLAVVTGGSGGIGFSTAALLLAAGYRLLLIARRRDALEQARVRLKSPGRVALAAVDSTDAEAMCALAARDTTPVSLLVTAAGTMRTGSLTDCCLTEWERLWRVNTFGTVVAIRAFLPRMGSGAAIVTVASTAGLRPVVEFGIYTSTKAAVAHITQSLALDLAPRGIRVNCVCPGVVETAIHDQDNWMDGAMLRDQMLAATPLGRLGDPSEVAEAILFLGSARSAWTTGTVHVADGGISLI